MLVYITKMGRTLIEAAQYLRTAPEDSLRAGIMDNGRQMLAQIRSVLEHHRGDLRAIAAVRPRQGLHFPRLDGPPFDMPRSASAPLQPGHWA